MHRYTRILMSLTVLALAYQWLGGFESAAYPDDGSFHYEDLAASYNESPSVDIPPVQETEFEESGTAVLHASRNHSETSAQAANIESPQVYSAADDEDELEEGWQKLVIGKGESFYVALQRAELSHEDIMGIVAACKPHTNLRKVRRGDVYKLAIEDGKFRALRFKLDREHFLTVNSIDTGMQAEVGSFPVQRIVKAVRGVIQTNLFDALRKQGADPALADQMAEILGWDIDFFRDLRKGDTFVAVYEEYAHKGKKIREGQILATQFTNQGHVYEAYLYHNDLGLDSYYDEKGRSLEKQFLRAPLKFSRISSGFSRRRFHPVTKSYRPHYGVDYAAPTGTPIMATAAGVVSMRSRKKGNGNYVALKHGNGYESYYLHLSKFPKSLKVGNKVQQGDIIGFVGQTGWATAPHLDYRIKKNGKWVNPKKLDLPPADPITDDKLEQYNVVVAEFRQRLLSIPADASTLVLESSSTIQGENLTR